MAKASSNWRGLKMCAGKIYSQFEAIACNRACCFRLMFAAPIQTLRIKTFSHPQMGLSFFPKKKINLGIHHFVTIPIIPYQTPKKHGQTISQTPLSTW
jgi:hypothetical protein